MLLITIESLSKTYTSGMMRKKKNAVSDVTLSIESGTVFGIIGVNGAGKSSILKMILGFIRPDAGGTIRIAGKKPEDPASRQYIGYLPENPYFYDHLTAEELLTFSAASSRTPLITMRENIDELLKQTGLYEVRKNKLRTYSKGMTQRAGICFALVHDPDIVILDEPMSGLDPLGRKMVIDLIGDLKKKGKTILFCSHILNDVERVCDQIAIMHQGQLKGLFKKDQIQSGIEDLFLKTIGHAHAE